MAIKPHSISEDTLKVMKKTTLTGSFILILLLSSSLLSSSLLSSSLWARDECGNDPDCSNSSSTANMLGWFDISKDLFLPQFDSRTDVDDIHSVAAVSTVLSDPRFSDVNFHAVAGAYGIQEGKYVPATDLFNMAFGNHWSDAHNDYKTALSTVTNIVVDTLNNGGDIWIAEAGQSDCSADMVRQVKLKLPGIDADLLRCRAANRRVDIYVHRSWVIHKTMVDMNVHPTKSFV